MSPRRSTAGIIALLLAQPRQYPLGAQPAFAIPAKPAGGRPHPKCLDDVQSIASAATWPGQGQARCPRILAVGGWHRIAANQECI
jgi:hypothetical protein